MSVQLLVSVRSADEARWARTEGVSLIDVKEPSRGPLGRADDAVITAIIEEVEGRRPVSAALGELREFQELPGSWESLAFVKWGLAGCAGTNWQAILVRHAERLGSRVVAVAYADAERAQAPSVEKVVAFACRTPWADPVLLIDTFDKSLTPSGRTRTILDSLSREVIAASCLECRKCGVRIALAGGLGMEEIQQLWPLSPDWFAVRGAVCEEDRRGDVSPRRIQALVEFLHDLERKSDIPRSSFC